MNIVLFALTGIGNAVLHALMETGHTPTLIVSRQETGVYPYYDEVQISKETRKLGIPLLIGEAGEAETVRLKPDVIFSATYHRRIPNEVISSAKCAFNLHPSLLPSYPGKNPFYWVLIKNESMTGVSIHRLTEKFDAGEVVLRKEARILSDETQGSLRLSLAKLAGEATKDFFRELETGSIMSPPPRRPSADEHFGQVREGDRIIDLKNTAEIICRQVRALTPWPCAVIQETKSIVRAIISVNRNADSTIPPGTILLSHETTVRAKVADAEIIFSIESQEFAESRR